MSDINVRRRRYRAGIVEEGGGRGMGKKRNKSSEQGSGALFVVLFVLYLVVKFIWWIIAAATAVALFYLVRAIVRDSRLRREIHAQRCAQIAARADQQHNWALRGDDRGIYGPEGAELMRVIRAGPTHRLP